MDKWVELIVTYDEIEAEIIRDILESEEIPVVIDSSKIRPYPVNIGRIGEVRVMVKKTDLKRAEEAIRIMKQGSENETK
jgi:DeoR/GlpR family transcriptional regulator of sugar metabolism